MDSTQLISSLTSDTRKCIALALTLSEKSPEYLTRRPEPNAWNILECIQHLNLYGAFYIPEIKNAIQKSTSLPEKEFHPGWLGDYFAKSMAPKENLNKMNTFKDKNPIHSFLDKKVLDVFLTQQSELLEALELSHQVSLNKVRIGTTLSRLIRLKLGDTFRFFINHQMRHVEQINKIITKMQEEK